MTVKQVFDEIASGTPIKIARGGKPAYQQSLNTFAESMQSLHSANSAARDRITLLCRYLGGAVVAGGLAVVVNNHNNPTPPIPKTVSEATQMFQDMSSGKSTAKPGDTLTPPQTETPTPTPNQLPAGYGTLGPQANPRHKPTGWFDIIPTDDQGNFLKSSDESDVRFVQANNISSLPPIPSVDEVYTQITKCLQNNDMMGLEKLLNNINGINKKVESEYMEAYNKMFGQKHQPPTPTPTQGTPQQ